MEKRRTYRTGPTNFVGRERRNQIVEVRSDGSNGLVINVPAAHAEVVRNALQAAYEDGRVDSAEEFITNLANRNGIFGVLVLDALEGVAAFEDLDGKRVLRIDSLPTPIPPDVAIDASSFGATYSPLSTIDEVRQGPAMVFVGTGNQRKRFACTDCGATVFEKVFRSGVTEFECNGCQSRYAGDEAEQFVDPLPEPSPVNVPPDVDVTYAPSTVTEEQLTRRWSDVFRDLFRRNRGDQPT